MDIFYSEIPADIVVSDGGIIVVKCCDVPKLNM